jgi:DNA-binding response OmpR family regulator
VTAGGGRWRPVVLLTQVGESTERAIALDEGADDYLNKPFDPYEQRTHAYAEGDAAARLPADPPR